MHKHTEETDEFLFVVGICNAGGIRKERTDRGMLILLEMNNDKLAWGADVADKQMLLSKENKKEFPSPFFLQSLVS
jgi:hypothetical protein